MSKKTQRKRKEAKRIAHLHQHTEHERSHNLLGETLPDFSSLEESVGEPMSGNAVTTVRSEKKPLIVWRVGRKALLGIIEPVTENFIALIVVLIQFFVVLFRHRLSIQAIKDNWWDTFLPWILTLCALIAWHVIKAAINVLREETLELPTTNGLLITKPNAWFRVRLYTVAMIYLFAPFAIGFLSWQKASIAAEPQPTSQMQEIKEVERFIAEPDELVLRGQFGLNEMLDMNIKLVTDMVASAKEGRPRSQELMNYTANKMVMVVKDLTTGHVTRHGGTFQLNGDVNSVFEVVLPSSYSINIRKLQKFEASPELPTSIIQALKGFDAAIDGDAELLASVENDALKKDPNYFLHFDDTTSPFFHVVDTIYLDKFVELRPKADKVRDAIRQFLGVK